ncbi:MAG: polymer-forming cytoskeletal protein [Spirochaetales bacterium]|nr:polymer-forming cytoskeletal protein [Spirochaetales bacterium]
MQQDTDYNSRINENCFFEGRYTVNGNLRIDGKFEGTSLLVDQVMVGVNGRVKADIDATSVVVEGIVIGNIHATRRILLLSTARVLGDIKTPELIIQDGVVLEGKCSISHSQINDMSAYIESIYTQKDKQPKQPVS